jgi:hypothetical protein
MIYGFPGCKPHELKAALAGRSKTQDLKGRGFNRADESIDFAGL